MKSFLAALVLIFSLVPAALAGVSDIKPSVKAANPALTQPQTKIKALPKSVVAPQTGQEPTGTGSQTQPAEQGQTPQEAALLFQGGIQFAPASADEPSCELRWQTTIANGGTAPSSPNLILRPVFRRIGETSGQEGQDILLPAIQPGASSPFTGIVPLRVNQESEIVLTLLDGASVVMITAQILPESAKPSAGNVALGEVSFSGSQATLEVRNTGAVDVGPMDCLLRGVVNDAGSNVYITGSTIPCIPAGAVHNVVLQVPETAYQAYLVQLKLFQKGEMILEKTFPRP